MAVKEKKRSTKGKSKRRVSKKSKTRKSRRTIRKSVKGGKENPKNQDVNPKQNLQNSE